MWAPALVVALALVTGGVAATQGVSLDPGPDRVGICHATGAGEASFVYLVVDRDGADHGHHAQHADDLIGVGSEAGCPLASPSSASAEQDSLCGDETVTGTGSADAGAEPSAGGPASTTNETSNETGNETSAGPGNETAADEGNETGNASGEAEDPTLAGLCDADVAVNHTASANGSGVRFDLRVDSVGTGEANDVLLDATFPDVGRPWRLVGTAPEGCLLEGRDLSCEFGDLLPNASRAVSVQAARCEDDCGDDLEANAAVRAHNDGDPSNNEAVAVLIVEDCPRGPTPTSSPSPSPSSTAPSPRPTPGNGSSQPANETQGGNETRPDNETGSDNGTAGNGNQTGNQSGPDNASEPMHRDASVAQRAEQGDDQVLLTIVVRSLGDAAANDVRLMDTLPDVRRPWHLSGSDADQCTLDGRYLNCWFGDLEPQTSRTIVLKAYTDRLGCGQHLTNNATVASEGDANARNDRSGASIEARGC